MKPWQARRWFYGIKIRKIRGFVGVAPPGAGASGREETGFLCIPIIVFF